MVSHLGAVPLNLKGMNSPFAAIAHLGIFGRASILPRPSKRDFRPSGLDSFISRACKGKGFEGFDPRVHCIMSPSRSCVRCSSFCRVHASWMVHVAEAAECLRKMVTSMLCDSLDCLRLQLRRGVPYRQTPPLLKYEERVRDKFLPVHHSSPVTDVSL
ncbi:hypothetical protein CRG98_028592 [Punica granatum]|uniref:Uncharacterized protein n=1 Tax=Punica granatum TaxID=22663 RepID=A0A2I0J535_PUNGR|nr:hypothetical protein CRG98_028592 [Punica granatum]